MPNPQKSPVHDLRSALELLKTLPGELVSTDVEVDPIAELSGVYRYVGAGGTCQRPTRKNGPAMLFNKVKGYPGIQVAIGLVGSRKRVGQFLNCAPERLGFLLKDSVQNPIPPVLLGEGQQPQCQEVVHLASDPDFDLRTLLPAPTNTVEDAGPYFTMGLCYASDPETGKRQRRRARRPTRRMDGREITRTRAHQSQSAIRPDFHRPGRDEHSRREILCRCGAGRRARPRDW